MIPAAERFPWLTRVFSGRARLQRLAAEPIPFHGEVRYNGIGPTNQPSPDLLLQESLGWSAIATRAISDRIGSLKFVGFQMLEDGEKEQLPPTHPLSRVLRSGSALHSPIQTQRLVAQYLVTLGEAYILKVRGKELAVPVELWIMHAARVKPAPVDGVVTSYVVTTGSGAQIRVPAEDVIRVWWADPENIYAAEGLLGPQGAVVDSNKFADQTMRAHFEQNAMPRAVIQSAKDATPNLDPAEIQRMNELWRQRFNRRAGEQRGLPAWLPAGFQLQEIAALGGVTELVPILQHWRDQVLMGFGVPRSIIGDVADANRAAAETNQFVFDTHTIKPIADLIAEAFTLQLAIPEFGDGVLVGYEDFIPQDKDFELRRIETELRMKLRSINEIRSGYGEDAVSWGDLPVGTMGETPYTGEELDVAPEPDIAEALDVEPKAKPMEDEDEPEDEPDRARGPQRDRLNAKSEWQRVLARERKWVPVFRRALLDVLYAQERELVAALVKTARERGFTRTPTEAEINSVIAAALRSERWGSLFNKKTGKVRKSNYVATGGQSLKLAGVTGAFELTPETAKRLRLSEDLFQQQVSSTTIKRVAGRVVEAMAASVEAGESASQRAARIQNAVSSGFSIRRKEALTIARTEMLKTSQAAQIDGWETSGVPFTKTWNNSQDDLVRDSHEIDGVTVESNEAFLLPASDTTEAEYADAPGVGADGAQLSAANTINCRCFLVFDVRD